MRELFKFKRYFHSGPVANNPVIFQTHIHFDNFGYAHIANRFINSRDSSLGSILP